MSSTINRIKHIVKIKLWSHQQINGKNSDSIVPIILIIGFFAICTIVLLWLSVLVSSTLPLTDAQITATPILTPNQDTLILNTNSNNLNYIDLIFPIAMGLIVMLLAFILRYGTDWL